MIIQRLGSGLGILALMCASIACLCNPPAKAQAALAIHGDQHAHACCTPLHAAPEHDAKSEKCPHCHQASLTVDSSTRFDARPIDGFTFLPIRLDHPTLAVVVERADPRTEPALFFPAMSLLEAHCALLL
jgi:hypothetical protein